MDADEALLRAVAGLFFYEEWPVEAIAAFCEVDEHFVELLAELGMDLIIHDTIRIKMCGRVAA